MKKVLFVGLSNKIGLKPLDSSTNSGKIIDDIITKININNSNTSCYKINLVNFAPLTSEDKLRYPTKEEMLSCKENFINEVNMINPDIIFLLGDKVYDFVNKNIKLNEKAKIIKIKHPSYIYVYKRKEINEYVNSVVEKCN